MLTQGSFSCPFVLHLWNRSFASANKIKSLKWVKKQAPFRASPQPLHPPGKQSCWGVSLYEVSLERRLECKPVFPNYASSARGTLWLQHIGKHLTMNPKNSRAKVDKMLIACTGLLGETWVLLPLLVSRLCRWWQTREGCSPIWKEPEH